MPTSNKRNNTKLHCQHCGKPRMMTRFLAVDTEVETKDGQPVVLPFSVKHFLDLIQSKGMYKLPRFYCGICATCFGKTYYTGQNHGTKLEVIPA